MKEYSKTGRMHPCKLEKADLQELIRILKESFPISERKEDFEIYTNLPNINIRSNSIEEFIEHNELPSNFNRLSIRIIGWNENRNIDKKVQITFFDNYIDLDVNGIQQTWVLGKYSQIKTFLKMKRPWFWALNKIFPIISAIITSLSLYVLVIYIKGGAFILSISTALFIITWIFATLFYFKGTFLPYTQIILTPKRSLLSEHSPRQAAGHQERSFNASCAGPCSRSRW